MDIGLAAAMMTRMREGDDGRYEGCVMLSALPEAPVVAPRRSVAERFTARRRASQDCESPRCAR